MTEFRTGDVWSSPSGIHYKVVDVDTSLRSPIAILRQGDDGSGRVMQRYTINVVGWTRISTVTSTLSTDTVQIVDNIFGKDWGSGAVTLYQGSVQIPMTPQQVNAVCEWLRAVRQT